MYWINISDVINVLVNNVNMKCIVFFEVILKLIDWKLVVLFNIKRKDFY